MPSFRPWQRDAIDALLEGAGRVLVVAPTGGGKSLCYQLPASVLGGTTIVVSPLIALMEDQVRSLEERGIPATYLASTLDADERRRRERKLFEGGYRLVFVAPERLRSNWLVDRLRALEPPLVAIDEAHCISQWGHDFRPDYLRVGEVLRELGPARVLACTATATPSVRDEIVSRLGLGDDTAVVLRGFARPNLHLSVAEIEGFTARRREALARVTSVLGRSAAPTGAAIIYAGTRRNTEKVADDFRERGWRCAAYHAGLDAAVRERVNAQFAAGELDVVVATNAFGMGIDRPDIRVVIHVQAPGSVEQYYQEVGRAGRDGLPAYGLLLSGLSDFGLRKRLIELGRPEGDHDESPEQWAERQWGMFLDLMRYVEAGSCRHDTILRYFGDEQEVLGGCGHCDICERLGDDPDTTNVSDEDAVVVRKALAGVARLRRRAGLRALAASLKGKETQRVRQLGLTELSTHGILGNYSEAWILVLLRRLMTAALVDVTANDYPVPYLTRTGIAVMKGDEPVRVLLPPMGKLRRKSGSTRSSRPVAADELPEGFDQQLYESLKAARLDEARERGVPAYVICHDRTLREVAARKPANVHELADVHGMGPARIESFGSRLLEVVSQSG
ncbi:MAG TPA: ATP-dependent DNA helicase RecQ [Polyangiaceae bacterium]|nr:ATP-dependent DNA helicase RecQ [Polyangiaceae bacterium]